jgi:hypothetical protein
MAAALEEALVGAAGVLAVEAVADSVAAAAVPAAAEREAAGEQDE